MSEEMNLSLDANLPPWDENIDSMQPDMHEDLEIYEKASHFAKLSLLSGNSFSESDLEDFIKKNYGLYGLQRLKIAKFVMKSFNLNPSNDALLMLSCTSGARVVIATAGAGKTTSLQIDLLVSKILDKALARNKLKPQLIEGTSVSIPRVLYLNYNKHNVNPIVQKHSSMCSALNKILKPSDAIDDDIESSTVHSFCHNWLQAFSSSLNLQEVKVMGSEDSEKLWSVIIKPRWTKFYDEDPDNAVNWEVLDSLYVYKTESMLDWDDFFVCAKFVDTQLKSDFVQSCIKKYDSMKKQMKLFDFTDYLVLMTTVLREHPELKQKLQERYSVIIADENQDFTKLMNELLLELYSPGVNQLVVVGDPDQTIYAFRGVSPDNVVNLCERLEDFTLLGLDTNYRCPDKIVDAAKSILDLNILRFKKPIETVRTGGVIRLHPTNASHNQVDSVINLLKQIGKDSWSRTVITYRNNISSVIVGEEMYYSGIPCCVLDDRRPFNNMVFNQITTILRALYEKDNIEFNKTLYRVLPMSKESWARIIEANRLRRHNHFHDFEVPNDMPSGSFDALQALIRISQRIETQPVCDFIESIIRLYRLYYFNFLVKSGSGVIDDVDNLELFLERTKKFYSRKMTFDYMYQELLRNNQNVLDGVTLSTFHGLKGLEFDYVIAIDFNDSIFPNYSGIDMRYTKNTAMEEKESENRLCYVLVTRTIKELHLFYKDTDPSIYVKVLTGTSDLSEPSESLVMQSVTGAGDVSALDSKMSFIQRLLGKG